MPSKAYRRAMAMHRVMKRISQTLGPFTPKETLRFEPQKELKGFSTFEQPRFRQVKPGFFERLYTELPRSLQRRFLLLDSENPAPTPREYRNLENEILGRARQKLMRDLRKRLDRLPRLHGHNGGRLSKIDSDECRRIRARVKELMQSGDNGEPMSKRKACDGVATQRHLSSRHVWRIVLGH